MLVIFLSVANSTTQCTAHWSLNYLLVVDADISNSASKTPVKALITVE